MAAFVAWLHQRAKTAQIARNSSIYGVCGALCRLTVRVWENRVLRAHGHECYSAAAGCLTVFTDSLNDYGGDLLRMGKNGVVGVVEIVPVSFLKRGWGDSWGYTGT